MKWFLSIIFTALATLLYGEFVPSYKSLVYAQFKPAETTAGDEGGDVEVRKSKKIVVCEGDIVFTIILNGTKISGNVDTIECGIWKLSGTLKGKKLNMKATNQENNDCCEWVIFKGTFNKKTKKGKGTWNNSCDGNGPWTLSPCG
jgi:hypothetical protein